MRYSNCHKQNNKGNDRFINYDRCLCTPTDKHNHIWLCSVWLNPCRGIILSDEISQCLNHCFVNFVKDIPKFKKKTTTWKYEGFYGYMFTEYKVHCAVIEFSTTTLCTLWFLYKMSVFRVCFFFFGWLISRELEKGRVFSTLLKLWHKCQLICLVDVAHD